MRLASTTERETVGKEMEEEEDVEERIVQQFFFCKKHILRGFEVVRTTVFIVSRSSEMFKTCTLHDCTLQNKFYTFSLSYYRPNMKDAARARNHLDPLQKQQQNPWDVAPAFFVCIDLMFFQIFFASVAIHIAIVL